MVRPSLFVLAAVTLLSIQASSQATETTASPTGDFVAQQGNDLWRVSKLVGVKVYGPGNQKVGNIDDVLLSREGKAIAVVIGVGGFLGIGEKDVAVPFDRVSFSQEPLPSPDSRPLPTGLGSPATVPGPGTGATLLPGPGNASTGESPAPVPPTPGTTAYPDHGTVSYTVDQLKAAPTFSFAR